MEPGEHIDVNIGSNVCDRCCVFNCRRYNIAMAIHNIALTVMTSLVCCGCCHGTVSIKKHGANDVIDVTPKHTSLRLIVSPRDVLMRQDASVTVECRVNVISRSSVIANSLDVGVSVSNALHS